MAAYGISTLGVLFGWAKHADTMPTSGYKLLNRINAIGGISVESEQIDASALEDFLTRYIAGRADTGGSVSVTVNLTSETVAEWQDVFDESQLAAADGTGVWFEVWSPYLDKAFFFVAQTPTRIPMPEQGQNELMTLEIPLTIVSYEGLGTASKPTETGAAESGQG